MQEQPAAAPAAPVAQQAVIVVDAPPVIQAAAPDRPGNDHDELAVLRDIVKRLPAAAVAAKTDKAAWGRYHREAKRLRALEYQLVGREQRETVGGRRTHQ